MRKENLHIKCELKSAKREQAFICASVQQVGLAERQAMINPQAPVAGAATMRVVVPVAQHSLPPDHRAVDPSPAAAGGNQGLAPRAAEHRCPTAVPSAQARRAGGAADGRGGLALALAWPAQQHPVAARRQAGAQPARTRACRNQGCTAIFHSDKGAQYTSRCFKSALRQLGIKQSMTGAKCWKDNIFVERFIWTLKNECSKIYEWTTGAETRRGIADFIHYYNYVRGHSRLDDRTPAEVHGVSDKISREPRDPSGC